MKIVWPWHYRELLKVLQILSGMTGIQFTNFLMFSNDLFNFIFRKHTVLISNKCFFLSPSSFSHFFDHHILPDLVRSINLNSCYWLPPQLLYDAIVQMKALEDLSIRDTKVPPPMLAEMLNNCPKITKLDFSFRYEKDWKNYHPKNALGDSLSRNLNRIKCLKILACADNVTEYRHDPWKPILFLLR